MATYNGARFLDEQMMSLAAQEAADTDIFVSDDGSSDETLELIARWKKQLSCGTIELRQGPGQGFAENFRSLIRDAPESYDYYAYSDQDDIWLADKFATAAGKLSTLPDGPACYCGRTQSIDEYGNPLGLSPLMARKPAFSNAIVQSIAGGNTMVINAELMALLRKSANRAKFVSHDWWTYIMATGSGATVIYDAEPKVLYRQHAGNLVGKNNSTNARLRRIRMAWDHQFARWTDTNLEALRLNQDLLTPSARETLRHFSSARSRSQLRFAWLVLTGTFYRQTWMGNASLTAAAALKRL